MYYLLQPFEGITNVLVIICIEVIIVFMAMSIDFVSGFHKAKIRGEIRSSTGLKRTVSKFILYIGSLCVACGIDSIIYICDFWNIIHFSVLIKIPVITTILALFLCVTEIRSIWEKAEDKQRRNAGKTAEMFLSMLDKQELVKAFTDALISIKDKKEEK